MLQEESLSENLLNFKIEQRNRKSHKTNVVSHTNYMKFSSVQPLRCVRLFATPWTAARLASLSFINSRSLILCHPLLLLPSIFPSIRVFPSESVLHISWTKYWSFSFSISPSNEYSGLISFRIDCLDLLQSKGLSRVFNTIVQKHQFFCAQLSL